MKYATKSRDDRFGPHSAHHRCYVRDGVTGLPLARQEQMLREAGADLAHLLSDRLDMDAIRRRDRNSLTALRDLLFAPPAVPPEMICVASLRVFGWSMADRARSVVAVGRRGSPLYMADLGAVFLPDNLLRSADLLEALAAAEDATRRYLVADAATAGTHAAASKRAKARDALLAVARPLWRLPPGEMSGAEVAARVGISLRSLHKWLGPRDEARATVETDGSAANPGGTP